MTPVEIALQALAAKADPARASCLRCCAKLRSVIVALARYDLRSGDGFSVPDDAIDAEVTRLRSAYPDLAARFDPRGIPLSGGDPVRPRPCPHKGC